MWLESDSARLAQLINSLSHQASAGRKQVDPSANQRACISAKLVAPGTSRISSGLAPQNHPTQPTPNDHRLADRNEAPLPLYETALFKNNFSMLGFVFATGFAFELGFNGAMNKYWDHLNRGRQWKDIRHKYVEAADDDEE
ncbi:ubiquinol-cytochrome C reductase [Colletotrichum tofieldiae]|uniref:Complex III subunit 9 n=1 Tax=Colletotrichum tofieldiae TaxID=708197 RepID=A0A166WVK1_9PEZI|nr:ubiquinol-cytochrome C reductase [Colletotrichum tofieldiae]